MCDYSLNSVSNRKIRYGGLIVRLVHRREDCEELLKNGGLLFSERFLLKKEIAILNEYIELSQEYVENLAEIYEMLKTLEGS